MTALKIVKIRNVFKPRWWELKRRYQMWRFRRDVAYQEQRMIELIGNKMYEEIQKDLESRTINGT